MKIVVFVKDAFRKAGIGRFLESLELPFLSQVSETSTIQFVYFNNIEETNEYKGDVAIYGGCLPEELEKSTSSTNKFYTFCSPFGQADLSSSEFYAPEIITLMNVMYFISTGTIKGCITSSKSLASRMGFIYIPMTRKVENKQIVFSFDRNGYSMLGNNFRKHRNVVNQIAAVSMLKPKMPIIVSNTEAYEHHARLFDCQFGAQDLKSDNDYWGSIAHHKLTFQCNFSESFSYLAYEYGIQGVPCICSHSIDWYPLKECIVDNPDNWEQIYTKAQLLLSDESLYRDCSYKIAEFTLAMARKNQEWLSEVVNENFIKLSE